MHKLANKYQVSVAQIATAWAIAKGTTPILGVTKTNQVNDAANSIKIKLAEEEIKLLETLAANTNVNTHGGWEGKS